jgi:hypothetical protein
MLLKAVLGTILLKTRKWQNELYPAGGHAARDGGF